MSKVLASHSVTREGVIHLVETVVDTREYELCTSVTVEELRDTLRHHDDFVEMEWCGYEDRQYFCRHTRERVCETMLRSAVEWLTERGVTVVAGEPAAVEA